MSAGYVGMWCTSSEILLGLWTQGMLWQIGFRVRVREVNKVNDEYVEPNQINTTQLSAVTSCCCCCWRVCWEEKWDQHLFEFQLESDVYPHADNRVVGKLNNNHNIQFRQIFIKNVGVKGVVATVNRTRGLKMTGTLWVYFSLTLSQLSYCNYMVGSENWTRDLFQSRTRCSVWYSWQTISHHICIPKEESYP